MHLSVTKARSQLGALCVRAQDPRETVILTRHDLAVAAIVPIRDAQRIWDQQETARHGWFHPLSGLRRRGTTGSFVIGVNGALVTRREAAEQMREVQMTRREERRVLREGGLDVVEGGEVGAPEGWSLWRGLVGMVWGRLGGEGSAERNRPVVPDDAFAVTATVGCWLSLN